MGSRREVHAKVELGPAAVEPERKQLPRPANLDLSVLDSNLVHGLRGRGRSTDDGTVVQVERAQMPGARHSTVSDLSLMERTSSVATAIGQRVCSFTLPKQEDVRALDA